MQRYETCISRPSTLPYPRNVIGGMCAGDGGELCSRLAAFSFLVQLISSLHFSQRMGRVIWEKKSKDRAVMCSVLRRYVICYLYYVVDR